MSRKPFLVAFSALSVLVLLFAAISTSSAQGDKPERRTRKTEKPARPERYAVVKSGDQYKVMTMTQVTGESKRVRTAYATKLREYKKAQQEARKNKQKFTEPKPERPVFSVLARNLVSAEAARKKAEQIKSSSGRKTPRRDNKKDKKKDPPKDEGDEGNS